MTTIHLVRHGDVHNPQQILYARLPRFGLSELGREQAQKAAAYFKTRPVKAVYSSPLLRARQTAQPIADALGLKMQISTQIIEIYTPYQGRPLAEMDAMDWNLYEGIPAGYDRMEDVLARLQKFCWKIRQRHPGGEVVAVTHGDPLLMARLWGGQKPLTKTERRGVNPYPANTSITTLTFTDGSSQPYVAYKEPYA